MTTKLTDEFIEQLYIDCSFTEASDAEIAFAREIEREVAEAFEAEFANLLPGSYYMDPPDGGCPSILEQVRRMAEDAAKWREMASAKGAK